MNRCAEHIWLGQNWLNVNGKNMARRTSKLDLSYSCLGSNYGGKAAYIHAVRGVLAGRLAEHETPVTALTQGAPPLTLKVQSYLHPQRSFLLPEAGIVHGLVLDSLYHPWKIRFVAKHHMTSTEATPPATEISQRSCK